MHTSRHLYHCHQLYKYIYVCIYKYKYIYIYTCYIYIYIERETDIYIYMYIYVYICVYREGYLCRCFLGDVDAACNVVVVYNLGDYLQRESCRDIHN